MSAPEFNTAMARQYLGYVYQDLPSFVWIGGPDPNKLDNKGKPLFTGEAFETTSEGLDGAVAYAEQRDRDGASSIYYRTYTLFERPESEFQRGLSDQSCVLPLLFTDIDYGTDGHKRAEGQLPNPPDEAGARLLLADVMATHGLPKPSLIVNSGGGLYALWVLDREVDTAAEDVQARNQGLQDAFMLAAKNRGWSYGDVSDKSRPLRLPYSVNRKKGRSEPALCHITADSGGQRVTVEKFPRRVKPEPAARREYSGSGEISGPFDALGVHASWGDILEPAGWTLVDDEHGGIDAGGCERWLRPGGASSDFSARAYEHNLVVFSDAAGLPHGAEQKLTKSRVFAHLYHDGNESAAATDLYRATKGDSCSEAAKGLPEKVFTAVSDLDARRANGDSANFANALRGAAVPVDGGSANFANALQGSAGAAGEGSANFANALPGFTTLSPEQEALFLAGHWQPLSLPGGVDPLPELKSSPALSAFCTEVADAIQIPRDFVMTAALPYIATAAKGVWVVEVESGWTEQVGLCALACLPSGDRKGVATSRLEKPIKEFQAGVRAEMRDSIASAELRVKIAEKRLSNAMTAAGKLDAKEVDRATAANADQEYRAALAEVPRAPIWRVGADGSPDVFTKLITEHKAIGILSSEPGLFAVLAGRYSKGTPNIEWFLQAYSGEILDPNRVTRETEEADRPVLSALSCIQPGRLSELGDVKAFRDSGLLARHLFSVAPSIVGRRKRTRPVNPQVGGVWDANIALLMSKSKINLWSTKSLLCSPTSTEKLHRLGELVEPELTPFVGKHASIGDWINKMVGTAARIAGALTLFNNPDATAVDDLAVEDGIALVRAYISHTKAAMALIDPTSEFEGNAAEVLTALRAICREKGTQRVTKRDLYEKIKGRRWVNVVADLTPPLTLLAEHGYIALPAPEAPAPGRPSETYLLNPAEHSQNSQNPPAAESGTPAEHSQNSQNSATGASVTPIGGTPCVTAGCDGVAGPMYVEKFGGHCKSCVKKDRSAS